MSLENQALDEDSRAEAIFKKLEAEEAAQTPPEPSPQLTEEQVSAPEGEKTGEAETPPAGEETGHSEPATAIEPPKFLKAEYRDKWKDLPTDWQQYLAIQEEENSRVVSTKLSEAAEAKRKAEVAQKAADDRAAAVAQEQQRYVQATAVAIQSAQTTDPVIVGYEKLKREDKLITLARENPAQYSELHAAYTTRMDALNAMKVEQQNALNSLVQQHMQREESALKEKFPEWAADPTKGKAAIDNLRNFVVQNFDFRQDEVQTIYDNRYVRLANAAYEGHQAKTELAALKADIAAKAQKAADDAAKAKAGIQAKKVTPQPGRTVVPGASGEVTGKTASERDKALIKQAGKAKSISDKAAILANLSG